MRAGGRAVAVVAAVGSAEAADLLVGTAVERFGRLDVDDVQEIADGVQVALTLTFETDSGGKPACVATILVRYYV